MRIGTRAQRAEQALKQERDYAKAIVEMVAPLLVLDQDLRVRTANDSFHKHFHVSQAQTENCLVYELGSGEWNIPKLRTFLEDVLPQHSSFKDFEVTHKFETIGRRTMLLSGRQVDDLQRIILFINDVTERTESQAIGDPRRLLSGRRVDDLQRIILFINDVTERTESQAVLLASEIRYRRLFEAARDGILILNPDTRKITDVNPFMSELLGFPREELLDKELWEIGLLKDEAASKAAFLQLQQNSFIRYENLPLQNKQGQRREVEFVSNVYGEDGRKVIQCNIRDITERGRMENGLRDVKAQLTNHAAELERVVAERTAQLRETIGDLEAFSYSVSHDMRAPLRAMQSFAQFLVDEYAGKLDEQGVDYLYRIMRSAARLDRLITAVLWFTITRLH